MKAVFMRKPGPPDVLEYGDLPDPQAGPGQVVVRVGAVSVNPIDTYIRAGADFWELPQPFIVGCDFSGTVEEIGEGVGDLRVGQRVWGTNQGLLGRQGTFAERIAVDACWVYPLPDGVSFEAAAACALVGVTAHLGLFREAKIQPNEWIFVQGGTGGVGSMVVQMAKGAGANVIATGGTPEKCERVRALGADEAICYATQDVVQAVRARVPEGVNVYWETVREPNFDAILAMMAPRGRIVVMAGRDARPPFPVGPFYVNECAMHGFVMFKASPEEMRIAADDIGRWLAEGRLKACIDRVLPLSEAASAHRLQEASTVHKSGELAGKIVLVPESAARERSDRA